MGKTERFLPYKEAEAFTRQLGLKGRRDWYKYCSLGKRPSNMSFNPDRTYKNKGWTDWHRWLNTSAQKFLPYEEAEKIIRGLGIKTFKKWVEYCRDGDRPSNIPASPNIVYKNKGWINWYKWLNVSGQKFLPYKEAEAFVRQLGFKNCRDWHKYCSLGKRPSDVPSAPEKTYKNKGWVDWNAWLGVSNKIYGKKYALNEDYFNKWTYNMAYVLGLWFADGNICGNRFSIILHKKDKYLLENILEDMGANRPLYRHDNCFLIGIENSRLVGGIIKRGGTPAKSLTCKFPKVPKKYLSDFIRGLWDGDGTVFLEKLSGRYHSSFSSGSKRFIYKLDSVLSDNIKDFKSGVYRKVHLTGFGHKFKKESVYYELVVGTNNTCRLRDFMYKNVAGKLVMKRKQERFMNSGKVNLANKDRKYLDYKKAAKIVRSWGLKSKKQWSKYYRSHKIDPRIPITPQSVYAKQWQGWQIWLGYTHSFDSFKKVRSAVRKLKIIRRKQWRSYCRLIKDLKIPFDPERVYKKEGWLGWDDWFGRTKSNKKAKKTA